MNQLPSSAEPSPQIEQARQTIDHLDQEMARLFVQRMLAVTIIAKEKERSGAPIRDKEREKSLLAQRSSEFPEPRWLPLYQDFIEHLMALSRKMQEERRTSTCEKAASASNSPPLPTESNETIME